MPKSSNVFICNYPVRFDTYIGCTFNCSYCFVKTKADISKIRKGESVESLSNWISGKRDTRNKMFDYDIPLHIGGMSDPLQPAELTVKNTQKCLELLVKTQYPYMLSTKSILFAEEPYRSLLVNSKAILQVSAVCSSYDKQEPNAPTFKQRLEAIKKISKDIRVIIRMQPYIPAFLDEVYDSLDKIAEAGVYGITFESIKYKSKQAGTIRLGSDMVYPIKLVKKHFDILKRKSNKLGMKFYSAENRLRQYGDSLHCCGTDGMGWKFHSSNLNQFLFDKENFTYTNKQEKEIGLFNNLGQSTKHNNWAKSKTYKQIFELVAIDKTYIEQMLPIK